jgi:hypothetical protein
MLKDEDAPPEKLGKVAGLGMASPDGYAAPMSWDLPTLVEIEQRLEKLERLCAELKEHKRDVVPGWVYKE